MLIPLGHSEAYVRKVPWVTILIMIVCLLVQVWASGTEDRSEELLDAYVRLYTEVVDEFGDPNHLDSPENNELWLEFEAGELTDEDDPLFERLQALDARATEMGKAGPVGRGGYAPASSPGWKALTCLFVHGGWIHLFGNMYFLYLIGCNIEDRWTRAAYLIFYLVGGLVSTATFALLHPDSEVVLVGASGAISAVMGAFMVVMGRSQITFFYFWWMLIRLFTGTFRAPAWVALLIYFLLDFVSMLGEQNGGGVAYSAHVGGFVFGAAVAGVLVVTGLDKKLSEHGDEVVFEQSQSVRHAIAALGSNPDVAVARLRAAVAAAPSDLGALDQLVDWFLSLPASPGLQKEFDFHVQDEARGGRDERLLETFARVRVRQDFSPSDRALLLISQAAARTGDNELAVDVVRELMRIYPRSPLVPRAMWDVSQIQQHAGQDALASRTRDALIDLYPDDPFASQARQAST